MKCFPKTQVKLWITFNEAFVVAWLGYGIGVFAPGVSSADTGVYEVAHNIIRSHTRAYRTYETSFKTLQQGSSSDPINFIFSGCTRKHNILDEIIWGLGSMNCKYHM